MLQKLLSFPKVEPSWPGDQDRLFIVGMTGSGKTHMGMWHLSRAAFDTMPWVVYDFKLDPFLASIPGLIPLDVTAPPPEHPGLYIVRPIPEDDDDAVDAQLTAIWKKEGIGVYIDEGYMIPRNSSGLTKVLTQGRSKYIPVIILSQRPVWLNRFVTSESEFKQIFWLQDSQDVETMQRWIPYPLKERLERYWSYYYDSVNDKLVRMSPAPDQGAIRATFARRLASIPKVL